MAQIRLGYSSGGSPSSYFKSNSFILVDYSASTTGVTVNWIRTGRTDTTSYAAENSASVDLSINGSSGKYAAYYHKGTEVDGYVGNNNTRGLNFNYGDTEGAGKYVRNSDGTFVSRYVDKSWNVDSVSISITCHSTNSNIDNTVFSGTLSRLPTGTPGNPTVTVGYSNVSITTATISGSVSSWGDYSSAGSYNLSCSNGSSGQSTSRNLTGLTPNTTYTVTFSATNNNGKSASKSTEFTTLANPSITSVTTTPSRTECSFTINVSYAQGDGFSSRTIQYGTTTSYGSSTTDTSIYNLTPNTKYYYEITINSTKGGTATYTGNFTTTHTAPSIGTITPIVGDTTCSFPTSGSGITYDNASYAQAIIKYRVQGTGSWAILTTSASPAILSGLDIVTPYEYEYTITDSGGGVSNTEIGTFVTTGQAMASIKKNGQWIKGKVFLKKNGQWVVAKKIFIKDNGSWIATRSR